MTLVTTTKVKPGRHIDVEREVRKLIFLVFDEQDIEIPYAHRVIVFKGPDGLPVADEDARSLLQAAPGDIR